MREDRARLKVKAKRLGTIKAKLSRLSGTEKHISMIELTTLEPYVSLVVFVARVPDGIRKVWIKRKRTMI